MIFEVPAIVAYHYAGHGPPSRSWCSRAKSRWPPRWPSPFSSPCSFHFIGRPTGRPIFYGSRCCAHSHDGGHVAGKPLLVSMCAVGILLPQCLWLADFASNLMGFPLLGLTGYMFDSHLPLFTRGLSLFHGWLPVLLVWLLFRLGYEKKALSAWTGLAAALGLVCYFFTPPAGAHWPIPICPSTSIISMASTTSSHKPGSIKTSMSSCGWRCCGWSPFCRRIWSCAKPV